MGISMEHRLLVLGSLDEFVLLVQRAKARGYYVAVCDKYIDGPAKKYADAAYHIDVNQVEEIVQLCKRERIDGIIGSFSDLLFERITEIADRANLKWYLKPDALKYYRKKDEAKILFSRIGIKTPRFMTVDKSFTDEQVSQMVFPLVIKPIGGYGSKGVYVVHSAKEIHEKYNDVAERFGGDKIIVEEYCEGHEYNLMAWLTEGELYLISIADRDRNPQRGERVSLLNRVVYPAKNICKVYEEACSVLRAFVKATGQKNGPISMQFFYNENGVVVCEIAGRIFGYEHEMVNYCSGLEIENLLLDYVYDEEKLKKTLQNHNAFFEKHCAGLYFVAKHGEVVSDLSAAQELQNDSHVIGSILFYKEGDTVDNYSSKPYFARYYISAVTREELDQVTEMFFNKMTVRSINMNNIVEELTMEKY